MAQVRLYNDATLTHTVKRRAGLQGTLIWGEDAQGNITGTVANGNFNNRDLLSSNTVEISATMLTCCAATHIRIDAGQFTVIGEITSCKYINENNTSVEYTVDVITSAIMSNMIADLWGHCQRTHLSYDRNDMSFVNQLSEPIAVGDFARGNSRLTGLFNNAVEAFEGVPNGSNENMLTHSSMYFALTVSDAAMRRFSWIDHDIFTSNPITGTPGLQNESNFHFQGASITSHSGGLYKGRVVFFTSLTALRNTVSRMLEGWGFRVQLPPNGYDIQDAVNCRPYYQYSDADNSYSHSSRNAIADPMESIRMITADDIFGAHAIPANFASSFDTAYISSEGNVIGPFRNLSNVHAMGAETNDMSKIMGYPYTYYKVVTANGDTINLVPQLYMERDDVWTNLSQVLLDLRYVGGDSPKLQGRFVPTLAVTNPWAFNSPVEWFTIRNYPSIVLTKETSLNKHMSKEVMQSRKLTALTNTALASASMESPFRQGVLHGYQSNQNRGWWGNMMNRLGGLIGQGSLIGGETTWADVTQDSVQQQLDNAQTKMQAGNLLEPQQAAIDGDDFMSQLSRPPIACYHAGGANSEVWAVARYFEKFGQSCGAILRPLTNTGLIFQGRAEVSSFDGLTFYQFSKITCTGTMPIWWKKEIETLFETGVYFDAL